MDAVRSCTQWGNAGTLNIPPIIDDGASYTIFDLFNNPGGKYPMIVFIDHTMTIYKILYTHVKPYEIYYELANSFIQEMLDKITLDLSIINTNKTIPSSFQILKIYPNPFNPLMKIDLNIALPGLVNINILDISGYKVDELYSGYLNSGLYSFNWNAEYNSSGVYFISINSNQQKQVDKVILLK